MLLKLVWKVIKLINSIVEGIRKDTNCESSIDQVEKNGRNCSGSTVHFSFVRSLSVYVAILWFYCLVSINRHLLHYSFAPSETKAFRRFAPRSQIPCWVSIRHSEIVYTFVQLNTFLELKSRCRPFEVQLWLLAGSQPGTVSYVFR